MDDFNYFEELKASLEDAAAYRSGEKARCRTVVKELPLPKYTASEVSRMRHSLNLSQRGLATLLGVSTRTVEAWEAGKNSPSGAASRLLYLFDCDHSLVERFITQ
jgi:putative transcriptional regulator